MPHSASKYLGAEANGLHTITVGDQGATNVKNIAIQLNNGSKNEAMGYKSMVHAYLTSDAAGETIIPTAPDGNVAIGTDGACIHVVTDKIFILTSEADGDIDLDIEETDTFTCYLVLINPNGTQQISGAITFDAA